MRGQSIVIATLVGITLSGCNGDSTDKPSEPKGTAAKAPGPVETYVPAPGDPKTHVLRVTIRDVGGVDAYIEREGGCVSSASEAFPHQLVVSGPHAELESGDLKSVDIPKTAQVSMGACESSLTITVPYAPRYTLGIAQEGQGIASEEAPDPTWITTRGHSQKVTLVSQVVTTIR